jgi:hypothetical protein
LGSVLNANPGNSLVRHLPFMLYIGKHR